MDYTTHIPDQFDLYIFDLDGTLIDSLDDLTTAMKATLARHGFPAVDRETVRRGIGNGARTLVSRTLATAANVSETELVARDIRGVVETAHAAHALVKVIIETALLTDEEKVIASQLSKAAGADFVKTSTGFGPGGATVEDVALMRRVVGPDLGVKASGGVRNYADTQAMIAAGATRIGASAGVAIVSEARR